MGLDGVNFDAFSYLHNVKKLRKQQKAEYKQTNKELTRKALSYVESNQAKGISAEQIDKMLRIKPQRTGAELQKYAQEFEKALIRRDALSYVESNRAKNISAEQIDKILGIRPQRTEAELQKYAQEFEKALIRRDALSHVESNQAKGISAEQINKMLRIRPQRTEAELQKYAQEFEKALIRRDALSYVESNQAKGISAEQINKMLGIKPQRTEAELQRYVREFEQAWSEYEATKVKQPKFPKFMKNFKGKGKYAALAAAVGLVVGIGTLLKKDKKEDIELTKPVPEGEPKEKCSVPVLEQAATPMQVHEQISGIRKVGENEKIDVFSDDATFELVDLLEELKTSKNTELIQTSMSPTGDSENVADISKAIEQYEARINELQKDINILQLKVELLQNSKSSSNGLNPAVSVDNTDVENNTLTTSSGTPSDGDASQIDLKKLLADTKTQLTEKKGEMKSLRKDIKGLKKAEHLQNQIKRKADKLENYAKSLEIESTQLPKVDDIEPIDLTGPLYDSKTQLTEKKGEMKSLRKDIKGLKKAEHLQNQIERKADKFAEYTEILEQKME